MFPRWDLCPRVNPQATSRDSSGQARRPGRQVLFLSKREARWLPPPTPLSALILMRGQQIEKWLRLSLRPTKIRDLSVWPSR